MIQWSDIVGYTCYSCGRWATHFIEGYGLLNDMPICCSCHLGYTDIYMEQQAISVNSAYQKGLPIDNQQIDDSMWALAAQKAEEFGYLGTDATESLVQQLLDKNTTELLSEPIEVSEPIDFHHCELCIVIHCLCGNNDIHSNNDDTIVCPSCGRTYVCDTITTVEMIHDPQNM